MKYLMLAVLVACSAPKPKPVVDSLYVDVCKPIAPRRIPTKAGSYRIATKECRIAKYWTIVNNEWRRR